MRLLLQTLGYRLAPDEVSSGGAQGVMHDQAEGFLSILCVLDTEESSALCLLVFHVLNRWS